MNAHVSATLDGSVLILRLDRPEKKNALTGAMYRALIAYFEAARRDPRVGAVLLTGSAGTFTAGNDLAEFLDEGGAAPAFAFIRAIATLDLPIVAAVEGAAVGIGTTALLHCDLAYAAPSAWFRLPFVDLGLVPEGASTLLLPNRVGLARASELLLLADAFGADEALRLGLINGIVPAEDLVAHALEQAARLAAKPRDALRETRRLLRGEPAPLLAALDREAKAFAEALASPQARAALQRIVGR